MVTPVTLEQHHAVWRTLKPVIDAEGAKLFLGHSLLKKEHGSRHGSMGTSSTEEDLWTTAFRRYGVYDAVECTQADCGIRCGDGGVAFPMSIKCTSSAIAVNWGKNKTKIVFQFVAPIFIVWHQKKSNKHIHSGIYMVDPEWCQANVTFSKTNNKTDYAVDSKSFQKMLERAKDIGTYAEIVPTPDTNIYCVYRDPDARTVEILRKPTETMLVELRRSPT